VRKVLPLFVVLLSIGGGCSTREVETRTAITIATGGTGGVYHPLGETLARIYTEQVPGITATAHATVASVFNVQAIQKGAADVAFTQGDVAYFAFRRGTDTEPHPHSRLRGMAVLYVNTVQIVAHRDGGIRQISDFRGKRIGVGAPGSGTEVAARVIIEGHGLQYSDVTESFLTFSETAERMQAGTLDAGFIVASYPAAAVSDAAHTFGIRLIPVTRNAVEQIRSHYPFFKPFVIPRGTYQGQTQDVETIGVDNLLICRDDLPEELVYTMTKALFENLPELAATHSAATLIDAEQGPATPIPLHPGAARYYRERELLK